MNLNFSLFLLFVATGIFAQDSSSESAKFLEVREKINKIQSFTPEVYEKGIESIREELERYFVYKKKVCSGEFSTIIFQGGTKPKNGASEEEYKTLSKEERKLCYIELKNLQMEYVKNLYSAREIYVKSLHEKEIADLNESKKKSLKSIQSGFSKFIR